MLNIVSILLIFSTKTDIFVTLVGAYYADHNINKPSYRCLQSKTDFFKVWSNVSRKDVHGGYAVRYKLELCNNGPLYSTADVVVCQGQP